MSTTVTVTETIAETTSDTTTTTSTTTTSTTTTVTSTQPTTEKTTVVRETFPPIKESEIITDYNSDKTFNHQKIVISDKIIETNTKSIIFGVGVVFGILFGVVGMAFVARRYQLCHCRRLKQTSNGDSQSDVRFLTSDEVIDFSLASDYDSL